MKAKTLNYYMTLNYPVTLEKYEEDGEIRFGLLIPDLTGVWADGRTLDEAYKNLDDTKKVWFETCLEDGIEIPEPVSEEEFSGKFLLRIDPKLHMQLTKEAKRMGQSLNQYIKSLLENAMQGNAIEKGIKELYAAIRRQQEMTKELSTLTQPEISRAVLYNWTQGPEEFSHVYWNVSVALETPKEKAKKKQSDLSVTAITCTKTDM